MINHPTEKEKQGFEWLGKNLFYFLKGDEYAVKFCLDFFYIIHLWDDLTDRDTERTNKDISDAFTKALVEIPQNPFYQNNINTLSTLVMNVILSWHSANSLEHGSLSDKAKAYMLRASVYQMYHHCTLLVGGVGWAESVAPEIYKMYGEDFKGFVKEMNNA